MKKRLLFALLLGGMALGVSAQTIVSDLTASKLKNADFTADAPVASTVYTYDYNMPDNGAGSDGSALFGQQPVTGWTANFPSDNIKVMQKSDDPAREDGANACAGGTFAYFDDSESSESPAGLGGDYDPPFVDPALTTNALGMVAVWGHNIIYSQDVELSAGAYMIIAKVWNQAGTGTITNNFGYVTSSEQFMSKSEIYPVGQWVNDTITFRLTNAASGSLQLGFSFGSGSGSAPHLFVDNVKLYQIDEQELIQAEIDKAKEELLGLIQLGKAYGVSTSESQSVYNNPSATMEQVQAAITKQKELNAAGVTDLSPYFITNPHFTMDDALEGGICTYDYDCEKNSIPLTNFSQLPVKGWTSEYTTNGRASGVYAIGSGAFLGGKEYVVPTEMSDGSKEGKVLGFVTCWTASVQYKQMTTLPAGQYTLTMSYYNTGGTTEITKNLIGFIENDGTEHLSQTKTFPVGKWTKDEVTFTLDEDTPGYFSLGYTSPNVGSGQMPHFFTDGISLVYVGEIDPSSFALRAAVNTGNTLLEEDFNADLTEQLEKAVSDGQDIIAAGAKDSDENMAATEAINSLTEAVNKSIVSYKNLKEFYEGDLAAAEDKYETTNPELYNKLQLLDDDIYSALEERDWDDEKIAEVIASLPEMIKEEVKKAWDAAVASGEKLAEDLDISILFNTLGATYSGSALQGDKVVDKQWVYGDASNFKTQFGTMEVWNQTPFEVSQTLKDMPAGKYTISTRAFYRTADNVNNYTNYQVDQTEKAFVFAGSLKTGLCNVAEIASADLSSMTLISEEAGVYVPNSQQNAHDIFEDPNYDSYTYKSVSTVLTETGDLTFGVKADQMDGNCWVVWYTFEIKYNAFEEDILDQELAAKIEELNTFISNNEASMTSPMIDQATDASENGQKAQGGTTEDKAAAINAINKALEDGAANTEAYSTLNKKSEDLGLALEQYGGNASEAAVTEATEVLSEIGNSADMTTEELIALSEKADDAMSKLKVPAHDKASDAEPVDFTQMIDNPSFEGTDGAGSLDGWTWNTKATGDTKAADNSNGTYTMENCDGAYVFNTWHSSLPEGGFFVSQTLKNLPAGTYELKAVLASDKDKVINLTAGANGTDFTMENEKGVGQEVSIIFTVEEGQEIEIKASSESWFKADNFRLTYFGTKSEKEPTTGIDDIAAPADMSKAVIYNLAGQRIQTLQKGINIVNGKKVYVK